MEAREQWSNGWEFLLSCIAMSVGLGNIWRFPFIAYENGGGAFLIPYFIVLTIIGRPMYYMELCMGQFSSRALVRIWDMVPAFRGIAYIQLITIAISLSYFVIIIAIALFYFYLSFFSPLPWMLCGNAINGSNCIDNLTATDTDSLNNSVAAAERFYIDVLNLDPNGLDNGFSPPSMKLTLSLFILWIIILCFIWKGVKSYGKASYFTALFPYLVLIVLLGKAVSLPGADKGLLLFITPQWRKLLDLKVWYTAIGQCFFSLGVAHGGLCTLASSNDFRRNIFRDAVIVSIIDTFTSIICGCLGFAVLGYLSEAMQIEDVKSVLKGAGGMTLIFTTFPDVLGRFGSLSQFFSLIFFLMLLSTGLGSVVPPLLSIVDSLHDRLPEIGRIWIIILVCITGFMSGLIYLTPQGQYVIVLVDSYAVNFALVLIGFMELVAVQWVYGYRNFTSDIEFMLNRKTHWYFGLSWVLLSPVILLASLIASLLVLAEPLTMGSYVYGKGALIFGIALEVVILCALLSEFIRTLFGSKRKTESVWKRCFTPLETYGPFDSALFLEYQSFKKERE